MPVKSIRFPNQTTYDGKITSLTEKEKEVLKKAGIGSTPENVLVAPSGLTKTKLVGVGTNGQENIEIGDNLTLANGKLSATGGGSGGGEVFDVITPSEDRTTYTGTITGDRPVLINHDSFGEIILTSQTIVKGDLGAGIIIQEATTSGTIEQTEFLNGRINIDEDFIYYHHFITLTKDNDIIYIQYQSTRKGAFSRMRDFISALSGKKVLCTAVIRNSDGTLATPLYVSGEAGGLKIYYVLKNDTSETITSKSIADYTISDKCSPLGL